MGSRGRRSTKSNRFFVQAMALVTLHAMTSILSLNQNKMTDSISQSQSIPMRCVCLISIQRSTMFSSCMEAASNGVTSHLASTRTHKWLRSLDSYLEHDHGLLMWSQWMWWTYWGEVSDLSGEGRHTVMLREIC